MKNLIQHNNIVKKYLAILLLATASIPNTFPQSASSSKSTGNSKGLTINVQGTASVMIPVDRVEINFLTDAMHKDQKKAQDENDKKLQLIKKTLLQDFDVEDNDIVINNTHVSPQYSYNNDAVDLNERKKLLGYRAFNNITVSIKNIDQYQEVISTILGLSIETINGVNFITSSEDTYYSKGLVLAFENAKQKARALAEYQKYNLEDAAVYITDKSADYPDIYRTAQRIGDFAVPLAQAQGGYVGTKNDVDSKNGYVGTINDDNKNGYVGTISDDSNIGDAQRVRELIVKVDVSFVLE